jgi:hypothetical protein
MATIKSNWNAPSHIASQRGGALIFVTIVGLVMTTAFVTFMTSTVITEQRAVEAELARSRAYWAEMGNFHYAMSRISYSRLCDSCKANNNKDIELAPVLQAYFNELSNNSTWTYADEAAGYSITTTDLVAPDDNPTRQNFSGWLMATSVTGASALTGSASGKLPLMELRLCVGLNNNGAKCGNVNNNNGGRATAYFSVNRLTNMPLP